MRIILKYEQKLNHMEEATPKAPHATVIADVCNAYTQDRIAFDILHELKTMFQQQAEQELFETIKAFHACKQEEGQFISTYVLKMKGYLDQMEHLGYPMPLILGVNLILTLLSNDYDQFIWNYNMHSMWKTIPELHAMLKLAEKCIPNKALGLRGSQKLNKGVLDLYIGNGNRAAVEAIGSFDLILPNRMVLVLDNCSLEDTPSSKVLKIQVFTPYEDKLEEIKNKSPKLKAKYDALLLNGVMTALRVILVGLDIGCLWEQLVGKRRGSPNLPIVQATEATDDSPAIPEHTTVETPANMSPENKAHFQAEKE
nr:hypothetical protein [Tanacetum cinerariifolium]